MTIIPVNDKKTRKAFHDTARRIYKDSKYWICPLDDTIDKIFDPNRNVFFNHGDAMRWILKNEKGRLIGRIGAFINEKKAYNFEQPTGGVGFFECIDDQEAANKLFDTAKQWLKQRGMEAMDGPINFGENDNFWGLLVEGFNKSPAYGMNYNHPYYQKLFENYGFQFYFEQVTNVLDLKKKFPERFWKIANWIIQKPGFTFEHFKYKKADKYINDLKEVYDDAWKYHENFTPINKDDVYNSLEEAKPILVEDFVWFAYHDGEPIAFFIMFPDFNQILQHFNGKIAGLNILKFLWLKNRKTISRTRVTIMGVKPRFQRMGIESGIFWHLSHAMNKHPEYTELELSWVGDFNPKMQRIHKAVGSEFSKRHYTYRKLFDSQKEVNRSSIISKDTKDREIKNK